MTTTATAAATSGSDHGNVYEGLLGDDSDQWAFGHAEEMVHGEDPLAGVDTTVPEGVDPGSLATYCLMLGDDALVLSHRLSEWASNAHDLEDDIALANIALDLLGQARLLLARAAAADPDAVGRLAPGVPADSPVPPEDALAFFRDERDFRNVRLVEADNGDFAATVARLLVFATYRLALAERLVTSRDRVLSAVAVKAVKELTYHRDYAGRWFLTLARGTEESRRRLVAGLALVWPLHDELFTTHPVERELAAAGVGVDPSELLAEVDVVLEQVLSVSGIDRPTAAPTGPVAGGVGRDGRHSESMGRLLAQMQVVARAHPRGLW